MIKINMKPFSKARPRVNKNGTHMPKAYNESRKLFKALYLATEYRDTYYPSGEISVEFEFNFEIPKSWTLKMKANPDHTRIVNDVDNLVGGVMDALNGIAWKDDVQVTSMSASKHYSSGGDSIKIRINKI